MRYIILVLSILLFSVILYTTAFTGNPIQQETALVTRVIDGDTVELSNGERVRLLGINTPERGQFLFKESSEWLRGLIEGETMVMESGPENRDRYNRLLRYLYLGDTLVSLELVRLGYAKTYLLGPEDPHYQDLMEAESQARENNLGVWIMDPEFFCIAIYYFHYNAKGNDNENLNDEYITFRNFCEHPKDLTGWALRDNANKTYTFPEFTLENKTTVTLHTGPGQNNETDLYWNQSRAVWNNQGDTLRMWNSQGELMLDYGY